MIKLNRSRVYVALSFLVTTTVLFAGHGSFTTSTGLYRIPYADGLAVTANNDHHNHPNAPDRVDLGGGVGNTIVAAASGIIRGIVDFNGNAGNDGLPGGGTGDGLGSDGATAQDDDLEHSCLDNTTVVGSCSDYNNYVWIEHPNGEWTKYTHFATGSVTANNWQVGDTVFVGDPLGIESDIGSASGPHLHFEVAVFNDATDTSPFSTLGGFLQGGSNLVTRLCPSPGFTDGDADNDGLYTDNEAYTAGPCTNTAPTADAGGPYITNEGSPIQLDGSNSTDPENAILNYSWSPATYLDDGTIIDPTHAALDDIVENISLNVNDLGGDVTGVTQLEDTDASTVTVNNVAPTVTATGDTINEGDNATVSATFTDPGTLDTHTATIDWDDGDFEAVDTADLAIGIQHEYCDNGDFEVLVTVTDDDSGIGQDTVDVIVANVNPDVTATGDAIFEGQTTTVSATFFDPGCDTHTATIDWGDGTPPEAVSVGALNAGVEHVYGDNIRGVGGYTVIVKVTDDDDGMGQDLVGVDVNNLDPELSLDTDDQISFPGGDYFVVGVNEDIELSASGSDAGSDDLVFDWSIGDINTYFNNGVDPDPADSPFGTFPFEVLDDTVTGNFAMPGVLDLVLTLTDDDGAFDAADEDIIVTGDSDQTRGQGWWKHQFSGNGSPHIDEDIAQAYLDIVNAVSSVFSELVSCLDAGEAHAVLSPAPSDARGRAEQALLEAWLEFASGAVAVDSVIPQGGKNTAVFLVLLFDAEAIIADGSATKKQLQGIEYQLRKVQQANP